MDQDSSSFVITPRTVFGVAIALLGFALALDRLGIAEASYLLRFWPVPLILIGALMFVQARDGRERTRGLVFAGIGTWLFLSTEGLIPFRIWELFWPVILILIGLSLVFRTGGPRRRSRRRVGGDGPFGSTGPLGPSESFGSRRSESIATLGPDTPFGAAEHFVPSAPAAPGGSAPVTSQYADRAEKISMFAVWSSVRRTSAASPFRGGDITAIMGGGQLDLRLATIPAGQEAILDIVAVMGGVEIVVPASWEVSTPILPFMGGVEDKRLPPLQTDSNAVRKDNSGRLVLRGLVMMGGVHIKS
jgi:predicted membrane protein